MAWTHRAYLSLDERKHNLRVDVSEVMFKVWVSFEQHSDLYLCAYQNKLQSHEKKNKSINKASEQLLLHNTHTHAQYIFFSFSRDNATSHLGRKDCAWKCFDILQIPDSVLFYSAVIDAIRQTILKQGWKPLQALSSVRSYNRLSGQK